MNSIFCNECGAKAQIHQQAKCQYLKQRQVQIYKTNRGRIVEGPEIPQGNNYGKTAREWHRQTGIDVYKFCAEVMLYLEHLI
jgi:hypothetical protein